MIIRKCPECGSKDVLIRHVWHNTDFYTNRYVFECLECGQTEEYGCKKQCSAWRI